MLIVRIAGAMAPAKAFRDDRRQRAVERCAQYPWMRCVLPQRTYWSKEGGGELSNSEGGGKLAEKITAYGMKKEIRRMEVKEK